MKTFVQHIMQLLSPRQKSAPAKPAVRYHFQFPGIRNFHLLPQRSLSKIWGSLRAHQNLTASSFGRHNPTIRS